MPISTWTEKNNYEEWLSGTDPNSIQFSIETTNYWVSSSCVPLSAKVTGGMPARVAILVESTNWVNAEWMPYTSSNILAGVSTNQGWHTITVAMQGRTESSQITWQTVRVKLDSIPPSLILTEPFESVRNTPRLRLRGYSPEPILNLTCSLTNAAGMLTNIPISVVDQSYNQSAMEFTTNAFECFDLWLTNGENIVTIRASDFAGNVAATNILIILDPATKTNVPVLNLDWPMAEIAVATSNFTWLGSVDDAGAKITATFTDTNGFTSSFPAHIEVDGKFRIENLPLEPGDNAYSLNVVDSAGNQINTNLTIARAAVDLSIFPPTFSYVSGWISDPTYTVYVNGEE